ncbi:hypothetical protein [Nocardioides marmotae]|nr:hypothetical protein [Nocardioides marmotae]
MGLAGAALLWASGGTGLSAVPASITPSSLGTFDTAFWAGLY